MAGLGDFLVPSPCYFLLLSRLDFIGHQDEGFPQTDIKDVDNYHITAQCFSTCCSFCWEHLCWEHCSPPPICTWQLATPPSSAVLRNGSIGKFIPQGPEFESPTKPGMVSNPSAGGGGRDRGISGSSWLPGSVRDPDLRE